MTAPKSTKESAVIVLHEEDSNALILTRRSYQLKMQPGEICFPGGIRESADKSLEQTALRELEEELGIVASRVKIISALSRDHSVFNVAVYPWLGRIQSLEPYQINPSEVAELIKIPMEAVLDKGNYREQIIQKYGMSIQTTIFEKKKQFVWGLTARIMQQLVMTTD